MRNVERLEVLVPLLRHQALDNLKKSTIEFPRIIDSYIIYFSLADHTALSS
jgi:hypothetical protein